MAAATHAGPISIEQINATFYVTGSTKGFATIQKAVDFVRNFNSGVGLIIVCLEHTGSDDIASVTGGGTSTYILDLRAPSPQYWFWAPTIPGFYPADFWQAKGFVAFGEPGDHPAAMVMGFDPNGSGGLGTGNVRIIANPNKAMPSWQVVLESQDGSSPAWTIIRASGEHQGTGFPNVNFGAGVQIVNAIAQFGDHWQLWIGELPGVAQFGITGKGMYAWGKPAENSIVLQGATMGTNPDTPDACDQAIRINPLGGDVQIGQYLGVKADGDVSTPGSVSIGGTLTVQGDIDLGGSFVANVGKFGYAEINELASSPTGGTITVIDNMQMQKTLTLSEDPLQPMEAATRHYVDEAIIEAGGFVFPPAGVTTSTGEAWGAPIDPATIAYVNAANIFTKPQTVDGKLSINAPDNTESFWMGQPELVGNAKGMSIIANAAGSSITFQGIQQGIGYNQALMLNPQGGDIIVGGNNVVGRFIVQDYALFSDNTNGNFTATSTYGTHPAWNICLQNETDFINVTTLGAGSGGFYWYNVAPGTAMSRSSQIAMSLDGHNSLTTSGGISANGSPYPYSTGSTGFTDMPTQVVMGSTTGGSGQPVFAMYCVGAPTGSRAYDQYVDTGGTMHFRAASDDLTSASDWMTVYRDTANSPHASQVYFPILAKTGNGLQVQGTYNYSQASGLLGITYGSADAYVDSVGSGGARGQMHFRIASTGGANLLEAMLIDNTGTVTVNNGIRAVGYGYSGANYTANEIRLFSSNGEGYLDVTGPDNTTRAMFTLRTMTASTASLINALSIDLYGNLKISGHFTSGGNSSGAHTTDNDGGLDILWNLNSGLGETSFINKRTSAAGAFYWYSAAANTSVPSGSWMMALDSQSNLHVNGIVYGSSKQFKITHPQDETKNLIHACLEGPENGVYYRGEGVTVDGKAIITLPDYFEALTLPDQRTVQLTTIVEQEPPSFAQLAAGRVTDGQFTVYSSVAVQKFFWEVKAVRGDIPALVVVQDKPVPTPPPTPPETPTPAV